jgi:predicted helicase
MYSRFLRWSTDRLSQNGIIALITNRSFIDGRTFDGLRASLQEEFNQIYVLDLGGDVRANPSLSGTTHNVFGIQTGVSIMFLIRKTGANGCTIWYARRPETERAEDKLSYLATTPFATIPFQKIRPDAKNNWINLAPTSDFDELIPLATKEVKSATRESEAQAIFKNFTLGIVTSRDEWVIDIDAERLGKKVKSFCKTYMDDLNRWNEETHEKEEVTTFVNRSIKWTSELEDHLVAGDEFSFVKTNITKMLYRPFVYRNLYYTEGLVHRRYQMPSIFPKPGAENKVITFLSIVSSWPLSTLGTDTIFDYCLLKQGNGATQGVPLWTYDERGRKEDNITDWALAKFTTHYPNLRFNKEHIFYYVYAVLNDPEYKQRYSKNLKRELPRIPFYRDFLTWSDIGKSLFTEHCAFGNAPPYPLKRIDGTTKKEPTQRLQMEPAEGAIHIDTSTSLYGVPPEAWDFVLANRPAIQWVLDQHREKKPKYPAIAEKFKRYELSEHKEELIELICRVTGVSVRTTEILDRMRTLQR